MLFVGCVVQAFAGQSILAVHANCSFISKTSWQSLVDFLGGTVEFLPTGSSAEVPFLGLLIAWLGFGVISIALAAGVCVIRKRSIHEIIPTWLDRGCRFWCVVGIWEIVRLACFMIGWETPQLMLEAWSFYAVALSLAGWAAPFLSAIGSPSEPPHTVDESSNSNRLTKTLWLAIGMYVAAFTWMNWQLYEGLLLPHGDSAMYEEHLWNLLHGKGFRSYLDQGLFFGEHIQFVHVFLIPVYYFWSSHLMLEFAESLALAAGAIPIFWMARRGSGSARCATCLAVSYLLYPPLQFLDIAIDLKTFRPMSFGIPAMLFAFDQFERRRLKTMLLLFVFALTAKEDFALILGPLGVWIGAQSVLPEKWRSIDVPRLMNRKFGFRVGVTFGLALAVFAVGYLLLTTRVLIPWFRDGEEVHYARYFAKFGGSMGEILKTMLTDPIFVMRELCTLASCNYVLALLLPLGFAALLSPTRFLVGLPVLVLLCLNQIIQSDPVPWHHFHGPIVPVLFWSAAAGLGSVRKLCQRDSASDRQSDADMQRDVKKENASAANRFELISKITQLVPQCRVETVAAFVVSMSFFVGFFIAMSPCSIKFWDSGSAGSWRHRFVPDERAKRFEEVFKQIPITARVASTDFVHPRFTHHERSYDYSAYVRKVAGYENRVPDDTDFIVIDCKHVYSNITTPSEVRELQVEPEKWELLEDKTHGYFIVLKRRGLPLKPRRWP